MINKTVNDTCTKQGSEAVAKVKAFAYNKDRRELMRMKIPSWYDGSAANEDFVGPNRRDFNTRYLLGHGVSKLDRGESRNASWAHPWPCHYLRNCSKSLRRRSTGIYRRRRPPRDFLDLGQATTNHFTLGRSD